MTAYAAEARKVTKRYGSFTALDKVDITVKRGAVYGLVGDNGAGKTTFLKLLSGHIYADEGELTLFGCHSRKDMEEQRRRTGAVIEAPGFSSPDFRGEESGVLPDIKRGSGQKGSG